MPFMKSPQDARERNLRDATRERHRLQLRRLLRSRAERLHRLERPHRLSELRLAHLLLPQLLGRHRGSRWEQIRKEAGDKVHGVSLAVQ
jgi:hypothetical protein